MKLYHLRDNSETSSRADRQNAFNFWLFFSAGFGDMIPPLNGLYFAYLIAGLALVFMNAIMVKNFADHVLLALQRELRLIWVIVFVVFFLYDSSRAKTA